MFEHPHRDFEIISYVVSGALKHQDSMGHTAVMTAGDVQRITLFAKWMTGLFLWIEPAND